MQCVVKKHAEEATEVVLSTDEVDNFYKAHGRLITPECLSADKLKLPDEEFIRYGLAEALIRREYAQGLPPDIKQAAPLAHLQVDETKYEPKHGKKLSAEEQAKLQEREATAISTRVISQYGECVARADPAGALRLALTEPSSAEESAAFAGLMGPLSTCLPDGTTVKLDKAPLRGTIALNLYRLAKAPRVTAGEPPAPK